MVVYQLKRIARGKFVPRYAERYAQIVRSAAEALPMPACCDRVPLDLAIFVGKFYYHSDAEMKDVARGRFTILGRTVDFGSIDEIDWQYQHPDENDGLFRMKMAQLAVVHSLIASGSEAHHNTALSLLNCLSRSQDFASRHAFVTGWSPYDTSHRILAIVSGLTIATNKRAIKADVRAKIEAFVRRDAGFLWNNIEYEMRNNHTERNLAALSFYHLASASISAGHLKKLERAVNQIVEATVLADGMQVERSAMYQTLTLMSLRIFESCSFLSNETRGLAQVRGNSAARALKFLTHDDGDIALFNDSWIGEVPPLAKLLDAESIALPSSLPAAGYFRIGSGSVDAIMDAGEIGPRWNPAHGHPDFLALEVDVRGHRLIVDPGTSQYSPGPQRTYERSSASHNGPHYSNVELVEYYGRFKVGEMGHAAPLMRADLLKLSVDAIGGRVATSVGRCTRVVCALPSGGLLIVDHWTSARSPGETNILIPNEWSLRREGDTLWARMEEFQTSVAVYEGRIGTIRPRTWSRRYFQAEPASSVTMEPSPDVAVGQALIFGLGVVQPSEAFDIGKEVRSHVLRA